MSNQGTRPNPADDPSFDWDVLLPHDGTEADDEAMTTGHHFDYVAQAWVEGHDHAHFYADDAPLFFCGADAVTCGVR